MSTISATEARTSLPEVLSRVEAGEEVTITRHGRPVAVMVRPDRIRASRTAEIDAGAAWVADLLEEGRRTPVGSSPGLTPAYAEALVTELRSERDAR
jgi:antitoxin (DNA-binding transcriptional repressor) of toxin-antitoxin stability system